jgi:MraZ protein
MPFAGIFPRVVDAKRRVAIPKQFRDEFEKPTPRKLFVTLGSFRCLWIITPEQFAKWGERLLVNREDDPELAAYRRMFYGRAETSELDRQGRILVPDRLAERMELKNEVLLIGVYDHIQLWDPERWAEYEKTHEGQFDATAERMFSSKL